MPRTLKKQSRKALKTKEKTRTLKFSRQSDDEYLQEEKTGSLSGIMKMNRLNISLIAAALLAAACQADNDSDLRSEGHVITARLGSDNALNLTGPLSSRLGLASFSIQVICDGYDTNIINVEQYDIADAARLTYTVAASCGNAKITIKDLSLPYYGTSNTREDITFANVGTVITHADGSKLALEDQSVTALDGLFQLREITLSEQLTTTVMVDLGPCTSDTVKLGVDGFLEHINESRKPALHDTPEACTGYNWPNGGTNKPYGTAPATIDWNLSDKIGFEERGHSITRTLSMRDPEESGIYRLRIHRWRNTTGDSPGVGIWLHWEPRVIWSGSRLHFFQTYGNYEITCNFQKAADAASSRYTCSYQRVALTLDDCSTARGSCTEYETY